MSCLLSKKFSKPLSVLALAITISAMPAYASSKQAVTTEARTACLDAAKAAERKYDIPEGLLQSIVIVESGANPFAVNYRGKGYMYANQASAQGFVGGLLDDGKRVIDVGCAQINLKWHPDAFANLDEAFDPEKNADYAARYLVELAGAGDRWERAVGQYHSPTNGERAGRYRQSVLAVFAKREDGFSEIKAKPMPNQNPQQASFTDFDYEAVGVYEVVSTKPSLDPDTKGLQPENLGIKGRRVSQMNGAIALKEW